MDRIERDNNGAEIESIVQTFTWAMTQLGHLLYTSEKVS